MMSERLITRDAVIASLIWELAGRTALKTQKDARGNDYIEIRGDADPKSDDLTVNSQFTATLDKMPDGSVRVTLHRLPTCCC